jgi:hypothetical protein
MTTSTPLAAVDFSSTVTDGLRTITTFVPKLIGALVILLVGYFIAKAIAKVLDKVLERVHFDEAVEKGPVKQALSRSNYDASDIVSKLVFYAIFIPFLSAAVSVLDIVALEQPMAAFIALIPKIIVAVVLVVVGGVVAGAVKSLVTNSLGGLSYGRYLADGLGILVMLGFLKAALDQVGIATDVTGPILYALLATVAGILIVGVGGALIKPMQGRLENALSKGEAEARTATQQVSSSTSDSSAYPSDAARTTTLPTRGGSVAR